MVKLAVAFYLGIDGGGSKTSCVIGDESNVLGKGHAAGSNVLRVGEPAARAALQGAIVAACAASGVESSTLTNTFAGVAGVGRADVREFVLQVLRQVVSGEVSVVTDADIALYAAFRTGPGVVVIAGTGSIALAQTGQGIADQGIADQGNTARAGGWGWAISDEGSGPWIGRAAVRAILRARDTGHVAAMERDILHAWQVADFEQLVRAANALPQPDFGALLPIVVQAADAADLLAIGIFTEAGRELASLAALAAKRLFPEGKNIRMAMSGGAFEHAPGLRKAFYNSVQERLPNAELQAELADPVRGALQMARDAANRV